MSEALRNLGGVTPLRLAHALRAGVIIIESIAAVAGLIVGIERNGPVILWELLVIPVVVVIARLGASDSIKAAPPRPQAVPPAVAVSRNTVYVSVFGGCIAGVFIAMDFADISRGVAGFTYVAPALGITALAIALINAVIVLVGFIGGIASSSTPSN